MNARTAEPAWSIASPPADLATDRLRRTYTASRQAQGFTSQAHLDAFYAAYDHVRACGECGQPGPAMWLEGSASWQPTETRCPVWRELDRAESAYAGR